MQPKISTAHPSERSQPKFHDRCQVLSGRVQRCQHIHHQQLAQGRLCRSCPRAVRPGSSHRSGSGLATFGQLFLVLMARSVRRISSISTRPGQSVFNTSSRLPPGCDKAMIDIPRQRPFQGLFSSLPLILPARISINGEPVGGNHPPLFPSTPRYRTVRIGSAE